MYRTALGSCVQKSATTHDNDTQTALKDSVTVNNLVNGRNLAHTDEQKCCCLQGSRGS